MDGGTRGSLVTRFCSSHRCGAVIRFLSADFRESPDSDSGAIRSSHVHDANLRRHVSRHHEVLGFDDCESPITDSSTLRSSHVRAVKHAVRVRASGVAFRRGAADMNSMRPPCSYRHDRRLADRFIA
jgi:hypothetical protein